jgi:hypothetical protein
VLDEAKPVRMFILWWWWWCVCVCGLGVAELVCVYVCICLFVTNEVMTNGAVVYQSLTTKGKTMSVYIHTVILERGYADIQM